MVDFECVSRCYHKYIYSANYINAVVRDLGRENHSDFVIQAHGKEKRDRFREEIFPDGGQDMSTAGETPAMRRKFWEGFLYSD